MTRRARSRRTASPPPPPPGEPVSCGPPVERREWIAIAAIVLLAAGLRFAFPDRMAIEHFDEGVYASNIFFTAAEGGQFPYRHLYAPPLLPFLIEWGIIFFGPQSIAPFLPALALGVATVPLAWWSLRCWFGPAAGLAAGFLIATSDFHLVYSRTALTDVPVAFFILLAVYLYWEAARRESLAWAMAAGLATGLAWWTKYTGWLPLAIAAAGSLAWVLLEWLTAGVSLFSRLKPVAMCFATTSVTAFVVWSPVLIYLQPYGGYAAVAENHSGYVRPITDWPQSLWEQGGNLAAQSGAYTTIGLAAFAAVIPLRLRWYPAVRGLLAMWCAAMVGWATWAVGPTIPLALLAVIAMFVELLTPARMSVTAETADHRPQRRLAACLLATWFCGMLVATPLYQPFPRLALPWLLAALLCSAVWYASTMRPNVGWAFGRAELFPFILLAFPLAVGLARIPSAAWFTASWTVPGWEERTGLETMGRRFARSIREDAATEEDPAVAFVHADPALFFHLASRLSPDGIAVFPVGNLSVLKNPPRDLTTYVGPGSFQPGKIATGDWWSASDELLRPIATGIRHESMLVRLDRGRPQASHQSTSPNRNQFYRVLP